MYSSLYCDDRMVSKRGEVGERSLQGCSKRLSDKAAGSGTTENEVRDLFQQPYE